MERWRLSGDLEEGELADLDDLEDVEAIEDEEVDPAEMPLPSDADLGWESEGLLTDHESASFGLAWRLVFYGGAGLAVVAALAMLLGPVLHAI
jgi:hypothetical protein